MNSFVTLALILAPLFVGFCLPSHGKLIAFADKTLGLIVFLILLVIGMELGMVDNLKQKLGQIVLYLTTLLGLTLGMGTLGLIVFDRLYPYQKIPTAQTHTPKVSLRGSLVQLVCLMLGFGLIRLFPQLSLPHQSTTVLLMVLLLFVGISLKGSGMTLRQAMLNRQGATISIVFMALTLLSGLVFAALFAEVSWSKGLALASGFGWYSLSGTVMTDAYGAIWGSVALLNDLSREIIALICIPYLMRYSRPAAIGLGGVTSLDFTLPTLQQSGGNAIVPTVISFGFITNVVSPILMVLFSSF